MAMSSFTTLMVNNMIDKLNKILENKNLKRLAQNIVWYIKLFFPSKSNILNKAIVFLISFMIVEVLGLILYSQFEKYISSNCNEICILVSQFFFDKYSFLILIISALTLAPLIYIRFKELNNEKAKINNEADKNNSKIPLLTEKEIKNLTNQLKNISKILISLI
jgi:uncharacterized membrane protein